MIDRLFHHNAWANAKVFSVCRTVEPALLEEELPGTVKTIARTLKHLVGVEDIYLAMLRGLPIESAGTMEAYFAHDLPWFEARASELGIGYRAWIDGAGAPALARDLRVPWFDFPVTAEEGLLQVLSHSAQHRSQVLTVLSARGFGVPDLDYVVMLAEERGPKP